MRACPICEHAQLTTLNGYPFPTFYCDRCQIRIQQVDVDALLATNDRAILMRQKLHPQDEATIQAAITGEGTVPVLNILAEVAWMTATLPKPEPLEFPTEIACAQYIRELRSSGYSWRAIALICRSTLSGNWTPASNQIVGMDLCIHAAKLLDEDPNQLPWN